MSGKVISIINMKGGVSKTPLTKELALYASRMEDPKKVLLIDVDPQMNLTQSLFKMYNYAPSKDIAERVAKESEDDDEDRNLAVKDIKIADASIASILTNNITGEVDYDKAVVQLDDNLSLIPGELGIDFLGRNTTAGAIEKGIHNFVDQHKLKDKFDFIFIDNPPTYSNYIVGALLASEYYLVPVRPEAYSILGIDMLLEVVKSVINNNRIYFPNGLINLGLIFTAIPYTPTKGVQNMLALMSRLWTGFFGTERYRTPKIFQNPDFSLKRRDFWVFL